MSTCGHTWKAPYLHAPPSKKITRVSQKCSLPLGHDGPHRSLSSVITVSGPEGPPSGADRLAQIEHNARSIIDPARSYESASELGKMARDVIALVEIAKAAREQAHEHPGEEWGYDASGIHVYDGPDCAGQGCPQCDALARLDSGAAEGDA